MLQSAVGYAHFKRLMNNSEDVIRRLLRIKEATRLSESPLMSEDNVQKLRGFIMENRMQIPSFALAHFDRMEASGKPGIAEITNGECSACHAKIPSEELEFLKTNTSIGVCDSCYAFIYLPEEKFAAADFFKHLLS